MATQVFSPPRGGLRYASKAIRQRVAQSGGYACSIRNGDLFWVERAEKGGEAYKQKYGQEAYSRLAKLRWKKFPYHSKTEEQRVKRLVVRDEKSGGYKCKRCGKKRNSLRSMQRHVKRHL